MSPSPDKEILRLTREISRLQREQRRLLRRRKEIKHDLKITRAQLRHLIGMLNPDADVVPMRLYGVGIGYSRARMAKSNLHQESINRLKSDSNSSEQAGSFVDSLSDDDPKE